MNRRIWPWLTVAALAMSPCPGVAAAGAAEGNTQGLALDTQTFVERTDTDLNGRARRTLQSAARAVPGDQVIHVIHWRNEGDRAMPGFTVTRPLSPRMRLDAATGDSIVSVDGGSRWGRLDSLWVPTPLGGVRRATAQDVTHIRWRVADAIAPGAAGRISYRTIVR